MRENGGDGGVNGKMISNLKSRVREVRKRE